MRFDFSLFKDVLTSAFLDEHLRNRKGKVTFKEIREKNTTTGKMLKQI
jgi:hypothetical protein